MAVSDSDPSAAINLRTLKFIGPYERPDQQWACVHPERIKRKNEMGAKQQSGKNRTAY